jgi:serine/threonine protein kinase
VVSRPLSDAVLDHLREVADLPDLTGTRYELVEAVGRGGMGVVYRARDRELDREVAIKVLDLPDASLATRLRREARVLARLEHPGIVPVHDVGELADGRAFYVMKLVRGQRLDEHGPALAGPAERLRVFERLCEPVAFAHAAGILHRDLKPDNVMVGPFGEVLVLDWGVAKVIAEASQVASPAGITTTHGEHGTGHGTVLGTPGYMAPEQARGEIEGLDARADVHALGGILFFLLTGSAPAAGAAAVHEALGGAPRPLRAICAKALAPDPAHRYATASALGADVRRYLLRQPLDAYAEGLLERGWRLASKYRTPLLIVLAYMAMRVALLLVTGR